MNPASQEMEAGGQAEGRLGGEAPGSPAAASLSMTPEGAPSDESRRPWRRWLCRVVSPEPFGGCGSFPRWPGLLTSGSQPGAPAPGSLHLFPLMAWFPGRYGFLFRDVFLDPRADDPSGNLNLESLLKTSLP